MTLFVAPRLSAAVAARHALTQRPYLERYLMNTARGAKASAIMFSIIETAKENGLDPYRYLTHIFRTAPNLAKCGDAWAVRLLPENAPPPFRAPKLSAYTAP